MTTNPGTSNLDTGHATLKFRTCAVADLVLLQSFVDKLYAEDAGEKKPQPEIALTFDEFTAHPDNGRIILFEFEGKPVGYAIIVFFWSNEFRNYILEIDELFVDSQYRRRGFAEQFFQWLKSEYAGKSGGWALQVSPDNHTARKFYEKLGFKDCANAYMNIIFDESPDLRQS